MKNITEYQVVKCLIFCIGLSLSFMAKSQNHIKIIVYDSISLSEKEAILILPGFGDNKKRRKKQVEYFSGKGYDVFIPIYIDPNSFDSTVVNVSRFIEANNLNAYKKLHCLTYIMGTWTLNKHILQNGFGNISSIISDRSPIQERAPFVVNKRIPQIGKMSKGPVLSEFSTIPYPIIPNPDSVHIGLIIENKATFLMRFFKKTTLSMGPISMDVDSLQQGCDDYIYTYLHHNEMYYRFDVVGKSVFSLIKTGLFLSEDRRIPYAFDYFKPYKP